MQTRHSEGTAAGATGLTAQATPVTADGQAPGRTKTSDGAGAGVRPPEPTPLWEGF